MKVVVTVPGSHTDSSDADDIGKSPCPVCRSSRRRPRQSLVQALDGQFSPKTLPSLAAFAFLWNLRERNRNLILAAAFCMANLHPPPRRSRQGKLPQVPRHTRIPWSPPSTPRQRRHARHVGHAGPRHGLDSFGLTRVSTHLRPLRGCSIHNIYTTPRHRPSCATFPPTFAYTPPSLNHVRVAWSGPIDSLDRLLR